MHCRLGAILRIHQENWEAVGSFDRHRSRIAEERVAFAQATDASAGRHYGIGMDLL